MTVDNVTCPTEGPLALELRQVTKDFGGLRAVNNVSIKVRQGERRAIIGPNGAGKTTLFNLISGELPVNAGSIHLLGRDVTRMPAHQRVALGLGRTYQITKVFLGLTVEENVVLSVLGLQPAKFALLRSLQRQEAVRAKARQALSTLGLQDRADVKAKELSYGEQRQLELALALAGDPKVLLLDEPAAGLSPAERGLMARIIRDLPRTLTIVLIEHDMDLALGLVDYVTCLHFGECIAEDVPGRIRENATIQQIYLGVE